MPNLKDLRNRIGSVRATRKITRAMQMVAASKLRRAQEAALAARAYSDALAGLMSSLAARIERGSLADDARALLIGAPEPRRELLVVATAGRGLCGGFNTSIVRRARAEAERLRGAGREVAFLCIGRKGGEALARVWGKQILDVIQLPADRDALLPLARTTGARIASLAREGRADRCTFFYARFESIMSQPPQAQCLVPAAVAEDAASSSRAHAQLAPRAHAQLECEPDAAALLNALAPRVLAQQVFQGLLENAASEQGARMTAMDSATRNADDMIGALSITYNRTRQALITKELMEIISGAEAL